MLSVVVEFRAKREERGKEGGDIQKHAWDTMFFIYHF